VLGSLSPGAAPELGSAVVSARGAPVCCVREVVELELACDVVLVGSAVSRASVSRLVCSPHATSTDT
jgi:hypothetical protein